MFNGAKNIQLNFLRCSLSYYKYFKIKKFFLNIIFLFVLYNYLFFYIIIFPFLFLYFFLFLHFKVFFIFFNNK